MPTYPRSHAALARTILSTDSRQGVKRQVRTSQIDSVGRWLATDENLRRTRSNTSIVEADGAQRARGKRAIYPGSFQEIARKRGSQKPRGWDGITSKFDTGRPHPIMVRSATLPERLGRNFTGKRAKAGAVVPANVATTLETPMGARKAPTPRTKPRPVLGNVLIDPKA